MTPAAFDIRGRRVLVTGGTRGIGGAISALFARAGAEVIANYARNDDAAQALGRQLSAEGVGITLTRADLTTAEGRARILETVGSGPLSALVHCAATGVHRPFEELTQRHWEFTFALNARAFFELVGALLPRLAANASIVALSSLGAVRAVPQYTLVGASKGALEALCRHLAIELAPRGLRVNVLSPGTVATDAWAALPDGERRLQEARTRSPRGRLTTPDEVAQAALFLCSDAAAGVSGHTLIVDAGESIAT